MDIRIVYRNHAEHTEALESHIRTKLGKVLTFLEHYREPITIDVTVEGHPSHAHNSVHIHVLSPEFETVVQREGKNLFALVDEVTHITHETLLNEKAKHVHDRKNKGTHRGT